jgi:hypothetical protein
MRQKLDIWQTNMLLTGKPLGAEIPAPAVNCRAFLSVSSYCEGPDRAKRPSIFLNGDHSDVRFTVRVVEVANEHFDTWIATLDTDHYERELVRHTGIANSEALEEVLDAYLDDTSRLTTEDRQRRQAIAQAGEATRQRESREATWIQQASADLGLETGTFRRLTPDETLQAVQRAEARFVLGRNVVWWWEHLRHRHLVTWGKQQGCTLVPLLAPAGGEQVWLIITDVAGSPLAYEGTVEACCAVIGECAAFEYYLVARDCSWLLGENHHDALSVAGFRALRRLKQVVREQPDLLTEVRVGGNR